MAPAFRSKYPRCIIVSPVGPGLLTLHFNGSYGLKPDSISAPARRLHPHRRFGLCHLHSPIKCAHVLDWIWPGDPGIPGSKISERSQDLPTISWGRTHGFLEILPEINTILMNLMNIIFPPGKLAPAMSPGFVESHPVTMPDEPATRIWGSSLGLFSKFG